MDTEPIPITTEAGKTYSISIDYGDAVLGGNSSFFDFQDKLHQGAIANVVLGNGKDIKGMTLEVTSTLPLTNGASTFASVIFGIDGKSIVRRKKIADNMRIMVLQTDIIFS